MAAAHDQGYAAVLVEHLVDAAAACLSEFRAPALNTLVQKYKTSDLKPSKKAGRTCYPICGKLVREEDLGADVKAINLHYYLIRERLLSDAKAAGKLSFSQRLSQ